ncbi:uncharacterized protein LOC132705306 isoform X2 [Cylas formicarius]|nr:uncharacterized protein LOC132705306 isoform X2 [Cylas formicarius]
MALVLSDAGYDVWLGNNRGNTFSRKHVSLSPDEPTFWNYSYHDIGVQDLPAMIDKVLNVSGREKLIYIGFSEGFTSFAVMGSVRPEYNDKILLMNAFAPVTNMHNVKSPIINFLADYPSVITTLKYFNYNELLSIRWAPLFRIICKIPGGDMFVPWLISLAGVSHQLDKNFLTTLFVAFPGGLSLKQLEHYVQGARYGHFRPYDYGQEMNLKIYKSKVPAPYDLTKITAPIVIYYGEDDYLVNNDENLLNRHNYTLVAYKVITEDGYILSMFRVNRKNEKLGRNTTKPPVFIMHGMTGSSFDWLIWAPNNSVALDIVNAGYDVWLGNNRGNTYSRRHIHLDPDDPNFWNFSYHEIGLYDLPAMIDRVLNETGFTKLTYLGMSQGFTSFVVMTSLRSEYNQKILVANCYAPATVLYKIKSPVMNFVKDNPLIFPETMLKANNYSLQIYHVVTEDGYILTLHRVQHQIGIDASKPPVFLMHGMCASSFEWILLGRRKALALILAEAGYDVWLGNNRGNSYSRNHLFLTPENSNFWNYSYHDIGMYDLPAMIDMVLKETGFKKLTYIGMSQGFTAFVVMASMRPEYNDKILLMNAYAPVTNMYNITSPLLRFAKDHPSIFKIFETIGWYDMLPNTLAPLLRLVCRIPWGDSIILSLLHPVGASYKHTDTSLLPTALINYPAGMSIKQLHHYIQGSQTGYFRAFDYGLEGNLKIYNNREPPSYDLKKIRAPIIFYYGEDDYLINNEILLTSVAKQMPNVVEIYKVPYKDFNHGDFMLGKNISSLTNKTVEFIDSYSRSFQEHL